MFLFLPVPPKIAVTYTYEGQKETLTSNQTVYVQSDKRVEMLCKATEGTPSPTITWFWQSCDFNFCNSHDSWNVIEADDM